MQLLSPDPKSKFVDIPNDQILYRMAEPAFSGDDVILDGGGGRTQDGRYHAKGQLTSYLSDNLYLCIAEKLHYLHRFVSKALDDRSQSKFLNNLTQLHHISVIRMHPVASLWHAEAEPSLTDYDLRSFYLTDPNCQPRRLRRVAAKLRAAGHPGVVFPSARHSVGHGVALFGDHTRPKPRLVGGLMVTLSLITADHAHLASQVMSLPRFDHLSHTHGYFSIGQNGFRSLLPYLWPQPIVRQGVIALSRMNYRPNYPFSAIRRLGQLP